LQRLTRKCPEIEHVPAIEALRGRFTHGIRLFEEAGPHCGVRCVIYALGLVDSYAAKATIGKRSPESIVAPRMVEFMIASKRLFEIEGSSARGGDLVVYFGDKGVEHVGLADRGRVRSKWGKGHVWTHPTMEVPAQYGTSVRYYKRVPLPAALSAYEAYALTLVSRATLEDALRPYRGPQS
jgi:hypothetical protein